MVSLWLIAHLFYKWHFFLGPLVFEIIFLSFFLEVLQKNVINKKVAHLFVEITQKNSSQKLKNWGSYERSRDFIIWKNFDFFSKIILGVSGDSIPIFKSIAKKMEKRRISKSHQFWNEQPIWQVQTLSTPRKCSGVEQSPSASEASAKILLNKIFSKQDLFSKKVVSTHPKNCWV